MKELQPLNENLLWDITEGNEVRKTGPGIRIPATSKENRQEGGVVGLGNTENHSEREGRLSPFPPASGASERAAILRILVPDKIVSRPGEVAHQTELRRRWRKAGRCRAV